jgi:hypothetical protein
VFSLLPAASWLMSDESGLGRTARGVPDLVLEVRQQCERASSLRGAAEETRLRLTAKRRVVVDLAEGRLTLAEAAARLRDLSAGGSERAAEETYYRQAVAEVRKLPGNRSDRPATLRRLEAELDGYLKDRLRHGCSQNSRG